MFIGLKLNQGGRMSFRQFFDLGLYKSSCILFASLFFVSCNTASSKPTEIVSAAGTRNIASSAITNINASAFLMMQYCPVVTRIQSRVLEAGGSLNGEQMMALMQEKDFTGRTLQQRLMSELASNNDCIRRVAELRENICLYGEYSGVCEILYQLEKLKTEDIVQEFEEFTGASVDSIDPSQLPGKVEAFVNSNSTFFGRINNTLNNNKHIMIPAVIALVFITVAAALPIIPAVGAALGYGAVTAASVLTDVAAVTVISTIGMSLVGWLIYRKDVRNRRRPN